MRHKLWLVIVILLLAAAGLFAFAATGHTYFAALLALIAALIVFYRFAGRVLKIVVTALLAIGVVVFVIIEIPIVKAARTDAPADCGYIVVLGAGLHGDVPSLSLRNRLDAALAWLEAHPDCVAVVSGGQGPGETMTEGEAMQIWLEAKGVDPSRIMSRTGPPPRWRILSIPSSSSAPRAESRTATSPSSRANTTSAAPSSWPRTSASVPGASRDTPAGRR